MNLCSLRTMPRSRLRRSRSPADRVAHTKARLDEFAELAIIDVGAHQYLSAKLLNLVSCQFLAPALLVLEGHDALRLETPDPPENRVIVGARGQGGGVWTHAFGNKGKRQHLLAAGLLFKACSGGMVPRIG